MRYGSGNQAEAGGEAGGGFGEKLVLRLVRIINAVPE
jgi:hypothetical protein